MFYSIDAGIAWWLLLSAVAIAVYTYVLFPLLLLLRARCFPKPIVDSEPDPEPFTPKLSIIICARDEQNDIAAKLQSILDQDYPIEQLQIIVASDGSIDDTNQIVRQFADRGVQLLECPRDGKIPTLNAALQQARESILVFSDANSLLKQDALLQLVRALRFDAVGCVAGDQQYRSSVDHAESSGEVSYWDFDRLLKRWQSQAGSVTSATGALYAIRAEFAEPIPSGVTDDFAMSTLAVRAGKRIHFEENAVAFETANDSKQDFARKTRILTRGFRSVWVRRALLNPLKYGFYAHQLLVHKLLRRMQFLMLAVIFGASVALSFDNMLFLVLLIPQLGLYACGGLIMSGLYRGAVPKPLALCGYFCVVNAACALAFWNHITGRAIDSWSPRSGA